MPLRKPLTPLELLAIVAVSRLGDDAYAVPIRREVHAMSGRTPSVASVYAALDRLDRLGLAAAWLSDPLPERGGRARRHYRLTPAGREFVRRERERALRMWRGVAIDARGQR
jgi:DNA-binding PadR family transcriptional regulator